MTMPKAIRYQANGTKLCVAMYRSNQRTTIHATMNETTVPSTSTGASAIESEARSFQRL